MAMKGVMMENEDGDEDEDGDSERKGKARQCKALTTA
jgi:hypothetical protein